MKTIEDQHYVVDTIMAVQLNKQKADIQFTKEIKDLMYHCLQKTNTHWKTTGPNIS